jgi:hypothetical protein
MEEATVITGKLNIAKYRVFTLRGALQLEMKGMHRRGQSAYAIIKEEFGFKGSKQKVLTQLNALLKDDARLTALLTDDEDPLSNCCTAPFGYPGWPDNDICSACGEHADASDEEDSD